MSYYQRHIFFCCNQRKDGKDCCAAHDAAALLAHAKDRVAELGLKGKGKVRVSQSGCLGRCDDEPVAVVYPEAVWYGKLTLADVDEIITSHLVRGEPVARLRLPD